MDHHWGWDKGGARSKELERRLRGVVVTNPAQSLLTAHLEGAGDLRSWQAMAGCDGSLPQGFFSQKGVAVINMTLLLV